MPECSPKVHCGTVRLGLQPALHVRWFCSGGSALLVQIHPLMRRRERGRGGVVSGGQSAVGGGAGRAQDGDLQQPGGHGDVQRGARRARGGGARPPAGGSHAQEVGVGEASRLGRAGWGAAFDEPAIVPVAKTINTVSCGGAENDHGYWRFASRVRKCRPLDDDL